MSSIEYVSKAAAIEACCDGFADCRDDCAVNIKNLPAADVQEVTRGHKVTHNRPISGHWVTGELWDGTEARVWVKPVMDNPVDYCSECGKRLDDTFQNFRPNCGAEIIE